jgi:16S rRNA (cytidine1402-2'-O)-methyltransferase
MPGTLFVVATPIGNLEDLTFRALRTLREVDLIAAEDTRRTSKLLAHYEISKPLVSLREHNEAREGARLVQKLLAGSNIALVSDAGTPGIADPGARFVRLCRDASIPVSPIPGPSAVTAALSVSGLDTAEFIFLGFVPSNSAQRISWLMDLADEARTLVMFESTHRFGPSISDITSILVKRQIQVYRELTKLNEQLVECTSIAGGTAMPGPIGTHGEFVIVAGPLQHAARPTPDDETLIRASLLFGQLTDTLGLTETTSYSTVADALGMPVSSATSYVKKGRILAKRLNIT